MNPRNLLIVIVSVLMTGLFACSDKTPQPPVSKPDKEALPAKLTTAEKSSVIARCNKIVKERENLLGRKLTEVEREPFNKDCVLMLKLAGHRKALNQAIAKVDQLSTESEKLLKGITKLNKQAQDVILGRPEAEAKCHRMIEEREKAQGWKFDQGQVHTIREDCMANQGFRINPR